MLTTEQALKAYDIMKLANCILNQLTPQQAERLFKIINSPKEQEIIVAEMLKQL